MTIKIGDAIVRVLGDITELRRDMREAEQTVEKHMNGIKNAVGAALAVFATGAVAQFTKAAVQEFAELESATVALGKVGVKNFGEIEQTIKEMNPQLGRSADLMQAYYQVVSAGVRDTEQAKDMLEKTAMATKAAGDASLRHADVIKGTTKLMAGFQGEIGSASDALDLLFQIENRGQTSFAELVPVIGDVAAKSKLAGLSVNEMGASLAQITQTAGSTSMASTQLTGLLKAMVQPTAKVKETLDEMGVSSGKVLIEQKGLAGALQELEKEAKKSGMELGELFRDAEAMAGVTALASNNFKGFNENLTEMGNRAGKTEKAFEAWQGTFEATQEKFNNTLGRVFEELGAEMAPQFEEVMDEIVRVFNENSESISEYIMNVGKTAAYIVDGFKIVVAAFEDSGGAITGVIGDIDQGFIKLETDGKLAWSALDEAANDAIIFMIESFYKIPQVSEEIWITIKEGAGIAWAYIESIFQDGVNAVSRIVADMMDPIIDGLRLIGQAEEAASFTKVQFGLRRAANTARTFEDALKDIQATSHESTVQLQSDTQAMIDRKKEELGLMGDLGKKYEEERSDIIAAGAEKLDISRQVVEDMQYEKAALAESRTERGRNIEKLKEYKVALKDTTTEIKEVSEVSVKAAESVKKATKEQIKAEKDRLAALKNFNKEFLALTGTEKQIFESNLKDKLDKFTENEISLSEIKKFETAARSKYQEESMAKQLEESKNFFDGIKRGYQQSTKDAMDWGNAGEQVFKNFDNELSGFFKTGALSILKGDLDGLEDAWKGMWDNMLSKTVDTVSQIVAEWAAAKVTEGAIGLVTSFFHEGAWEIKQDEQQAVLQKGEMVLPRDLADQVRGSEVFQDIKAGATGAVKDFFGIEDKPGGIGSYGATAGAALGAYRAFESGDTVGGILGVGATVGEGLKAYGGDGVLGQVGSGVLQGVGSAASIHAAIQAYEQGNYVGAGIQGVKAVGQGIQAYNTIAGATGGTQVATGAASQLGSMATGAGQGSIAGLAFGEITGVGKGDTNAQIGAAIGGAIGSLVPGGTYFGAIAGQMLGAVVTDLSKDTEKYRIDDIEGRINNMYGWKGDSLGRIDWNVPGTHFFDNAVRSFNDSLNMGIDHYNQVVTAIVGGLPAHKQPRFLGQLDSGISPVELSQFGKTRSRDIEWEVPMMANTIINQLGNDISFAIRMSRLNEDISEPILNNLASMQIPSTATWSPLPEEMKLKSGAFDVERGGKKGGGIIDQLIAPGEDGLASLQYGEGVISRKGMDFLDRINAGGPTSGSGISEGERQQISLLAKLVSIAEKNSGGANLNGLNSVIDQRNSATFSRGTTDGRPVTLAT